MERKKNNYRLMWTFEILINLTINYSSEIILIQEIKNWFDNFKFFTFVNNIIFLNSIRNIFCEIIFSKFILKIQTKQTLLYKLKTLSRNYSLKKISKNVH